MSLTLSVAGGLISKSCRLQLGEDLKTKTSSWTFPASCEEFTDISAVPMIQLVSRCQ